MTLGVGKGVLRWVVWAIWERTYPTAKSSKQKRKLVIMLDRGPNAA